MDGSRADLLRRNCDFRLGRAMADAVAWTMSESGTPKPDPRDPDYSRHPWIFVHHNCWRCDDGKRKCVQGSPNTCEFPRARNE